MKKFSTIICFLTLISMLLLTTQVYAKPLAPSFISKNPAQTEFTTDPLDNNIKYYSDSYVKQFVLNNIGYDAYIHMNHRVMKISGIKCDRYTKSPITNNNINWSGYVADLPYSNDATGVFGSFNVVSTNGTAYNGYGHVSEWVGIGGLYTSNLLQVGTDSTIGTAWYEIYPIMNGQGVFSVKWGDQIDAGIYYDYDNSNWFCYIQDNTSGEYWAANLTWSSPDQNNADWILENGISPTKVASFSTGYFTSCDYRNHLNEYKDINDDYAYRLLCDQVRRNNIQYTSTYSIKSDGQSFEVHSLKSD